MSQSFSEPASAGKWLFLILGLIAGAGAASGAFFVILQRERQMFAEDRRVLEAQVAAANAKAGINLPFDPAKLIGAALDQIDPKINELKIANLPGLDALAKVVNTKPETKDAKPDDEEQIIQIGKGFVADLENNRLASAYRTTSAAYQQKVERKIFDELINKAPNLRRMTTFSAHREHKTRRSGDGKRWEYYFTGRDSIAPAGSDRVNVALTLTKDGDEWRIDDVEISAESK